MFSDNRGCTIASIGGRDKKCVERRLKACGALGPGEEIGNAVEAVSFDDTLEEIERVVEEDLSEDRVIPVNSVEMYEVIADFERKIKADRTAHMDTKSKTVDWKVRPIAAPLLEDSWERMKGSLLTQVYEIRLA